MGSVMQGSFAVLRQKGKATEQNRGRSAESECNAEPAARAPGGWNLAVYQTLFATRYSLQAVYRFSFPAHRKGKKLTDQEAVGCGSGRPKLEVQNKK